MCMTLLMYWFVGVKIFTGCFGVDAVSQCHHIYIYIYIIKLKNTRTGRYIRTEGTYIHTHTHTRTHSRTHSHTYAHRHMHARKQTPTYKHMHSRTHAHISLQISVLWVEIQFVAVFVRCFSNESALGQIFQIRPVPKRKYTTPSLTYSLTHSRRLQNWRYFTATFMHTESATSNVNGPNWKMKQPSDTACGRARYQLGLGGALRDDRIVKKRT